MHVFLSKCQYSAHFVIRVTVFSIISWCNFSTKNLTNYCFDHLERKFEACVYRESRAKRRSRFINFNIIKYDKSVLNLIFCFWITRETWRNKRPQEPTRVAFSVPASPHELTFKQRRTATTESPPRRSLSSGLLHNISTFGQVKLLKFLKCVGPLSLCLKRVWLLKSWSSVAPLIFWEMLKLPALASRWTVECWAKNYQDKREVT